MMIRMDSASAYAPYHHYLGFVKPNTSSNSGSWPRDLSRVADPESAWMPSDTATGHGTLEKDQGPLEIFQPLLAHDLDSGT